MGLLPIAVVAGAMLVGIVLLTILIKVLFVHVRASEAPPGLSTGTTSARRSVGRAPPRKKSQRLALEVDEAPTPQLIEHGVAWFNPHDERFVERRFMRKLAVVILDDLQDRYERVQPPVLVPFEDRDPRSQRVGDGSGTCPILARGGGVLVRRDKPHVATIREAPEKRPRSWIEDDGNAMVRHGGNSSGLAVLTVPPL